MGCFMVFIFGFVTCSLRRTPRPPAVLGTPGLINSIPAFSNAETSFIRESTFPRTTPSLASTGGPELVGRNHEMAASGEIRVEYIYTVRITVSSINLDAKYISAQYAPFETD